MAKNTSSDQPDTAPSAPIAPVFVSVTANTWIYEADTRYKPGDQFETTAERAAALGDLVTIVP